MTAERCYAVLITVAATYAVLGTVSNLSGLKAAADWFLGVSAVFAAASLVAALWGVWQTKRQ